MKIFSSLFLVLFSSFCMAQEGIKKAPDFVGKETVKGIYNGFKQELHESIQKHQIKLYPSTSLDVPLSDIALQEFFTMEEATIFPVDEYGFEFKDTVLVYSIEPSQWQSLRFEKEYLTITIADSRKGYIKNKDLKKINPEYTACLERLQSQLNPQAMDFDIIENQGVALYDSIQARLFQLIKAGSLPIFSTENIGLRMSTEQFDTLFNQESYILVEDFETGELTEDIIMIPFEAYAISGMSVRYTLEPVKNGWDLRFTHFGLNYRPLEMQGAYFEVVMVWINWKDIQAALDDTDWFLLQEIIKVTQQMQEEQGIKSDNF